MHLVEREEQLIHLRSMLDQLTERRGSITLLDAPAANGKTALLRAAGQLAEENGALVLHATASAMERSLPLGILRQLRASALLPPGDLGTELDGALRAAQREALAGPSSSGELLHSYDRLCAAVLALSESVPLFVGIDDVHHADPPSLRLLLHLARRLGSTRIMVVLTDHADLRTLPGAFRAEILRRPWFHRLRLAPLSRDGVARLLASPGRERRPGAEELYALTGGNLLALHTLAEEWAHATEPELTGYGLAVAEQVQRGDPVARAVARAVAVLGPGAGTGELAQLAGVEEHAAGAALHALAASGLLGADGFRHPSAARSLLAGLAPQERDRLRLSAAALLHERGADPGRVAEQLMCAGSGLEPWAVEVLREAADQALLGHRPRRAADLLTVALRTAGDRTVRAAVQARLLHAEWQARPAAVARHLLPLATEAMAGTLEHTELPALVGHLLWHGRPGAAADILARLRSSAGAAPGGPAGAVADGRADGGSGGSAAGPAAGPAAPELARLEGWLAWTHPALAAAAPGARAERAGAHSLPGTPLGPVFQLTDALRHGRPQEALGQAESALARLGKTSPGPWAGETLRLALDVLVAAGRSATAAGWAERLAGLGERAEAVAWRAELSAARAAIALRHGEFDSAVRHAREALALLPAKSWGVAVGLPLSVLVLACTRAGRLEEAGTYLSRAVPETMFETRYGLGYLHARGHFHLASGQWHAALADFQSCGELMRAWGVDVPGMPPWRIGAAEAWLRLGNRDRARRLTYEQQARPGAADPHARALALSMLASTGGSASRPHLLSEALQLFEDCGDIYHQGRTLAALGQAHHALGDNRRARMLYRRARHMAALSGSVPLCEELLALLPTDGAGDRDTPAAGGTAPRERPSAALTDSERRVAALAARGYTNREIAAKLYVTPSTVEQHLTRTFRKLGVKQRKELPVVLGAPAAD
ncbi:AAA family ATPase [Streptomyces harbinensis]|uniref:helix-turn-helix transcriptional regulator n=1 Tax=Streptomyces harbinensis TaxID=1176198 RepID=UPI00371B097F